MTISRRPPHRQDSDATRETDLMDAPALHPPDQTLCSYGLGKLDADAAESVNKHLESCPACRCRVAELSSDSFLGRLREAQARPDFPSPTVSSVGKIMAKEPERRFQEPMWESLIDLREQHPLFDMALDRTPPSSAPALCRRGQRAWSTAVTKLSRLEPRHWWAAAGVLLLGLVVVWAGVLRLRTSNGTIELVDLPKDAEVFVDGEEVAVTLPGGVKPAVVTVTAGKHKISEKLGPRGVGLHE